MRIFTYIVDAFAFLVLNTGFKPLSNWAVHRVVGVWTRPEDHRDASR